MLDGIFSVRVPRTLIFPIACALLTSCLEPGQGVSAARGALPTAAAMGSVSGTHLLILDEDAINNGNTRNRFSARDVNDDIATVGLRKTVRYFRDHIGKEIVLPAGKMGDEGWFAPKTTWAAWSAAGPEVGNGFLNYVVAGPGLGRCDSKGKRETLLDKVPDVVPLRAAGLAALKGRSFCVVVMDGDVRMQSLSPLKADLRGPNLGKAAFEVLQVSPPSGRASELPEVKIRILNADVVCDNPLTPLPDVPVPGTYCDNDGGVCRPNELLIEESWNTLDTTKWVFDGDGLVANGFFQAREDARSAMADWIMPCPVRLESNSAVRFANRLHLDLAQQHDFAEAGALFFVQAGPMGSSENYVFLNVGYTLSPSKVFVELFGADGGTQFDQFLTTSLDHQPSLDFDLDLWIDRGSYRVGVNGEAIDTVRLSKPIEKLSLFEVGAQQLGLGLRGLVDKTGITRTCKSECKLRPRKQERCEPCKSCQWIDCGSRTCNTKSDKTRCDHDSKGDCPKTCNTKSDKTGCGHDSKGDCPKTCNTKSDKTGCGHDSKGDCPKTCNTKSDKTGCGHDSKGDCPKTCNTKSDKTGCGHDSKGDCPKTCNTKSDKTGCDHASKPDCSRTCNTKSGTTYCDHASTPGKDSTGGSAGSGEPSSAQPEEWGPPSPNPCVKNDLILMARAKVSEVAEPLEGLRILAGMPLAPNCEELRSIPPPEE